MSTRPLQNLLVTGGAGFIGSNFIRYILGQSAFTGRVLNVDALTYAGNVANLAGIDVGDRHVFEHRDIRDAAAMQQVFATYDIDSVVHFAAESHVDRSVAAPADFVTTNIVGTFHLLEAARAHWLDRQDVVFHHVSTDEVYGALGDTGIFTESTPYDPRSPYAASKASADHLVRAYAHTYALPVTLSNCSNNYGPYQFPEKLIPLMLLHMLEGKPLPVYGKGENVRDWLHVDDHAAAIWQILHRGRCGETWNVGGGNEWRNIDLVEALCDVVGELSGRPPGELRALIEFVSDRPGHDYRYAVSSEKLENELGWQRRIAFRDGLRATVSWYMANRDWVDAIRSGAYQRWMEHNYDQRD
jgi:dTDP-glucose 4,6-dehydratase